ncbi:hypothetical protein GWK41_01195 [Persephonella atlantica]|uniref:Uncharacterized protein n=1 Tax=Persephonella atlantica TaxID=2699429 RepID=A0ABS1GFK2_9AQUI|nr:hypothetical protein [Persephonella atlantica]MBK3331678.1 hypothetical protein [Persephonella atlantica]
MSKKFPVENKKTPSQYILVFFVLLLVGIAFVATLIAIPYLFYLLVVVFFKTFQFGIVFVIVFWLVVLIVLWTAKILQIMGKNG